MFSCDGLTSRRSGRWAQHATDIDRFTQMPFTQSQRTKFLELLQTKGWKSRDGVISSPSGGLKFADEHLSSESPEQMRDLFADRAKRLRPYHTGPLAHAAGENDQVSWAAGEVISS